MPAHERQAAWQRRSGSHDRAFRAADIGDHGFAGNDGGKTSQHPLVLAARGREDHKVGLRGDDRVVGADINGMQPDGGLDDVVVVDSNHKGCGPCLAHGHGQRAANQAQPNDGDTLEHGRGRRQLAGLHHAQTAGAVRHPPPQPRRTTGSTQIVRPIAGAMIRSSAIRRSNCDGNIVWAPSLSAWSGSTWTSIIKPSAPAATAARAIGATLSRRPVP
jgi:hypothetical protein